MRFRRLKTIRGIWIRFLIKYLIAVTLVVLYLRFSITGHSSHPDYQDAAGDLQGQPFNSMAVAKVKPTECPDVTKPPSTSLDGLFQRVADTDTFVYSAYEDGKWIRVLSLRKLNESQTFTCHLWYRYPTEGLALDRVQAEVKDIPRAHNPVHTASFILCKPSRPHLTSMLFAVSITKRPCEKATNWISVQNISKSMTSKFLVCVPPIHHALNDYEFLVESIEFKRLLGVQRFVFYMYDIGEELTKILLYYKSQGIVDLINWPIPLRSTGKDPEIYYYGQIAAVNDCLYRYRHRSEYIIFQDIDEFFVPQGNLQNLSQLIERRLRIQRRTSFQIRNVFFPSLPPGGNAGDDSEKLPVVLRQNVREKDAFPYNKKAKCIVDPRRVETVGIHQVIHGDTDMDLVPVEDAIMYHYRLRSEKWRPENGIIDKTVETKYGSSLVTRLKVVWEHITKSSVLTS